ncbi:phospholipase [Chryseobacterium indologenes]|uniref:carboxylesterase family protein n=1 Tax=Chryseobacterium indologenes TaxID=253 RepID=UPI000F4DF1B7|nr:PHB depolymerase family esterase [Chryseobacterium indologenes]AYZ36396.1 phospholipase [Chryseobacterium indologenes]MBF6645060.1 phospholipase [Chryseobacterium indologenes]MBU3050605.1 phospholipase [Chryseobacterium indologenes]MEB4759342.1 phospholipase [Chryseobacterium indologenes]QQQ71262.1 phospholipase [Chryseobacterium indologenes]
MQKQILYPILAIVSTLIMNNFIFAQKKEFRNDKVDTLTFLNNRKTVNSLNTEAFQRKIFLKDMVQIPYRLLTPKNNIKTEKYPLVITFHNSTRIGIDNENQLEPFARIWLRNEIYSNYQCFVIAPQFSKRSSHYEKNAEGIQVAKPSDEAIAVLDLINEVEREHPNIDKDRIYLIGYSMGASTAQNLMNLDPLKFAAIVSVAAVPDFSNFKKLQKKRIWLIHGEKDNENPYNGSVELFNKLSSNPKIIFTTFTQLNHNNIVIPFLLTEEIPKWLFKKY